MEKSEIRADLKKYFDANVYPQGFYDKYQVAVLRSPNPEVIQEARKSLEAKGYTVMHRGNRLKALKPTQPNGGNNSNQ